MSNAHIKRMKDLPSTHLLGAGTPMCSGCGGLEALHEIYDVLGEKTVFVNAAGCMTLLSVYPFTPFRGSWLYTAMASARLAHRACGMPWTFCWNRDAFRRRTICRWWC